MVVLIVVVVYSTKSYGKKLSLHREPAGHRNVSVDFGFYSKMVLMYRFRKDLVSTLSIYV